MPEYNFKCDKCNEIFTKVWTISSYDNKIKNLKCPSCKSSKIFREYDLDQVVGNYINGLHECKTLGEYADKQTAKMSRDERDAKLASFKTKKNPNSGMKQLPNGMTRSKYSSDMPRISKSQAKRKRNNK